MADRHGPSASVEGSRFDATIPLKEALRRSSESGRMPSATGYGLVASELVEAFNGLE